MAIAKRAVKKMENRVDNRAFWGRIFVLLASLAVLGAFFFGTWWVLVPPLSYFILLYISAKLIPKEISRPIINVLTVIFIAWAIVTLGAILVPFVLAILFAYLLDPIVDIGESWGIPRSLVILIIFVVFGSALILALSIIVPRMLGDIINILETIQGVPQQVLSLAQYLYDQLASITEYGSETFNQVVSGFVQQFTGLFRKLLLGVVNIFQALTAVISTAFSLIVIPFLTFYLLRDIDKIKAFIMDLVPQDNKESFRSFMWQVDRILSGYFRGQLMMSAIEGGLLAVGLTIIGMPYALLLGFIGGMANLIPYVGVLIGAIPAILVSAFTSNPLHMIIYTVILYVVVQTVDAYIIAPRIIGQRVGLHPVLVILSVMAGAKLFGIVGFFLATPVAGVGRLIVIRLWRRSRGLPLEEKGEKKPLGKGGFARRLKRKKPPKKVKGDKRR